MILDLKIGDKVKTRLIPMACGLWNSKEPDTKVIPPSFYHTWEIVEIGSDLITLKDKKGEIMMTDKDGFGIENYTNHHIYKIVKNN